MPHWRPTIAALLFLTSCGGDPASAPDAGVDASPDAAAARAISLTGMLPLTGLPIHDVWAYTDAATGKEYALLCASTDGLRVIDVNDRSKPVLVGTLSGGGVAATDVKTWKNYAYVVGEGVGVTGNIIDLTDPTTPVAVGTFPNAHNIFISSAGYMYLAAPGLRIYDLNATPETPAQVYSDSDCRGHDVAVVGDTLYDFSDDCGTRIFDVTDPSAPALRGTVVDPSFSHHSGWPSSDGNYLFICDELASPTDEDITVWDISDLANVSKVDSFSDPDAYVHNLYVVGNDAYVSYYRAGFRVFDVTDPTNIELLDEYDTDPGMSGPGFGGNFGVYPFNADGTIFASDEENGLFLFGFGSP